MATVKQEIDVQVPVSTAYNQWTQFEELPRFMEGVKEVRQLDDAHLHWVAQIGSAVEEWDAEIVEQVPDRVIAWRSLGGKPNSGVVRFEPLGTDQTRVMIEMEYEPEGIMQGVGAAIGVDDRKAKGDLERFRDLIEGRGVETGAWRGEIHGGHVTAGPHGPGPGFEGGESTFSGGSVLGGGSIGGDEEYGTGLGGTGTRGDTLQGELPDTTEAAGLGGSGISEGRPSTGLGRGAGAERRDTSSALGDALDEDYEGMPIRDDRIDERDV